MLGYFVPFPYRFGVIDFIFPVAAEAEIEKRGASAECEDTAPWYCAWAVPRDYCSKLELYPNMKTECRKSCNFCTGKQTAVY